MSPYFILFWEMFNLKPKELKPVEDDIWDPLSAEEAMYEEEEDW